MFATTKKLFLPVIIFASFTLKAQDNNVFDRLHGETFEDALYITFDGDKFTYSSALNLTPLTLKDKKIFLHKNKRKASTAIVFYSFVNPLKYTFTSNLNYIDDPIYSSVQTFFNSGNDILSKAVNESQSLDIEIVASKATSALGSANNKLNDVKLTFHPSILMGEWIYHFLNDNVVDQQMLTSTSEKAVYIFATVNKVTKVDSLLFLGIKSMNGKTFDKSIQDLKSKLYSASDLTSFKEAYDEASKIQKILSEELKESNNAINEVSKMLNPEFEKHFKGVVYESISTKFKFYSSSYSMSLKISTEPRLKEIQQKLTELESFLKNIKSFKEKFNSDGFRRGHELDFSSSNPKMAEYSIEITPKNENGELDSKGKKSITFNVAVYDRFVPFASVGVLTSQFSYPTYSAVNNNGDYSVVETGNPKINTRPALFLNLLTNVNSRILYPFVQIGLVNGEGYPVYPLGVGLNIGSNFSLSFGYAFGERLELPNDINSNPITSEADLKNRMVKNWHADTYFSVNIKFATLKK